MSESLEPSTFMHRQFAELSDAVSAALVEAGWEAHARSADAKDGSRLETNHAYGGTLWLAIHEEVTARLAPILNGAVSIATEGGQYHVLVWQGVMILPVTVKEHRGRDGHLLTRVSGLRDRLMGVNMPAPSDPTLFGEEDDYEVQLRIVEAAREQLGGVTTTVVVAYRCSPTTGIEFVEAGLATLGEDGSILFTESERLEITPTSIVQPQPILAGGEAFSSAPMPKPALGLVEEVSAAGENDIGLEKG